MGVKFGEFQISGEFQKNSGSKQFFDWYQKRIMYGVVGSQVINGHKNS